MTLGHSLIILLHSGPKVILMTSSPCLGHKVMMPKPCMLTPNAFLFLDGREENLCHSLDMKSGCGIPVLGLNQIPPFLPSRSGPEMTSMHHRLNHEKRTKESLSLLLVHGREWATA